MHQLVVFMVAMVAINCFGAENKPEQSKQEFANLIKAYVREKAQGYPTASHLKNIIEYGEKK
ncbi:MAG TPA: hypothetical protein VEK38_02460 [Candidatus Bathyarchaeia archaeon]|nr:hypothetical protein [Candidatus Bathyarchaeia archaeon]